MKEFVNVNPNQVKDFLRAIIVEDLFYPCTVHSVNMCGDELRGNDESNNNQLNMDAGHREFVDELIRRSWKIDEICCDHFRMIDSYSTWITFLSCMMI